MPGCPPQPRNVVQLHRGMKRAGGHTAGLRRHGPGGWLPPVLGPGLAALGLGSLLWVLERARFPFLPREIFAESLTEEHAA